MCRMTFKNVGLEVNTSWQILVDQLTASKPNSADRDGTSHEIANQISLYFASRLKRLTAFIGVDDLRTPTVGRFTLGSVAK